MKRFNLLALAVAMSVTMKPIDATFGNLKLHLGCNSIDFGPGWIHVDAADHPHVHKLQKDISRLDHFANNSASIIYASHVFEYFDRAQAQDVLRDWRRVLRPGGTLRLAVPDFGAVARLYVEEGNGVDLDTFVGMLFGKWVLGEGGERGSAGANGPASDVRGRAIYHRTAYDRPSLMKVLEESGFTNAKPWNWQLTEHGRVDDYSQAYWPHSKYTVAVGRFAPHSHALSL